MKEIKIEFIENGSDLIWTGWLVSQGDKYADGLGYDEMLGLVAALTMPVERPCLRWLKTEEQHKAYKNRFPVEKDENGITEVEIQ